MKADKFETSTIFLAGNIPGVDLLRHDRASVAPIRRETSFHLRRNHPDDHRQDHHVPVRVGPTRHQG